MSRDRRETANDLAPFVEHGNVRNTPAEQRAAALTCADNATDAAEAGLFLAMLGLGPDVPSGKRIGRRW